MSRKDYDTSRMDYDILIYQLKRFCPKHVNIQVKRKNKYPGSPLERNRMFVVNNIFK